MPEPMPPKTWESTEGDSYPLGLTYIGSEDAYNFAIYSRHATSVTLLIYNAESYLNPIYQCHLDYKINKSGRIWHCRVNKKEIPNGRYYAYRIGGPSARGKFEWHTFDNEKILLDPYARAVFFPDEFDEQAAKSPGQNDGKAPLGVILNEGNFFDWQNDRFIHHEGELIIYEIHVKGFTYCAGTDVKTENKGTFKGLVDKIPYLKELGITAVELMPVHQFVVKPNEYWGYNTLNFFSPHNCYCSSMLPEEQINEFKFMVRELHKAGIEVILDVVYNHTAEGDHNGPVYSYKGIDNSTYYLISDDLNRPYFNCSGTGNTTHTRNNTVRRLILESLHYWRTEMHVDGFRFDLASVFSRNTDGSLSFEEPTVLGMINSDPDLATARFIAEPWDASGAFYLGKKFPGVKWMQWNSFYRDDVRLFVKSFPGMVSGAKNRLYGSADIFSDDLEHAFHAYQSINYITSHDGFTLWDLVSYNTKHNEINGENNTDGAPENHSWNCGIEGDLALNSSVIALRQKQLKNFCTLLFLSNGTPMFVAGDEFLRTQKGNNNPYNQDNEISWIDWSFKEKNHSYFEFFKKMIAFRKKYSAISRSRFWREDVEWFGETDRNWDGNLFNLAFYLKGVDSSGSDLYVMINNHWNGHRFAFQKAGPWKCIVNTALCYPNDFVEEGCQIDGNEYVVLARSVCVFVCNREGGRA